MTSYWKLEETGAEKPICWKSANCAVARHRIPSELLGWAKGSIVRCRTNHDQECASQCAAAFSLVEVKARKLATKSEMQGRQQHHAGRHYPSEWFENQ